MKNKKIKKVVYTVLLGDRYKLHEPKNINKDWSLICFTDQNIKSKNWKIIRVNVDNDPRKKAREIKIRCDKYIDFDVCLFIDAKFTIKCNIDEFIEKNLKSDIALMKHNKRSCIYDEANFCLDNNIGNKIDIIKQIKFYKKMSFPMNFGLYGTGILIRNNTLENIKFMKLWYNEVEKYSYRDQISFSYTLWKNSIELSLMSFKETYRSFT